MYFIVKYNHVHRLILLRAKTVKGCHSSAHSAPSSFQTQIFSKTIGVTANTQQGIHEIHTLQNAIWCHPCRMSTITLVQLTMIITMRSMKMMMETMPSHIISLAAGARYTSR